MKTKILGVLGILILGGIVYAILRSSGKQESSPQNAGGPPEGITQEQKPGANLTLLYLKKKSTGSDSNKLSIFDLKNNSQKLVFTDLDEDFQIRLVDGIYKTFVFIFGTPLNESAGSIWQISLDGSGTKKQVISQFSASAFCSNGEKIAFISYDNVKGVYDLFVENMDGRFKNKILESETNLSDPIIVDKTLGFVKIDNEGNGTILVINFDGSGQKEILKTKGELIYGLSYAANKFAYMKQPKSGTENLADVYVYDLSTQAEKRITNDKANDKYPVLSKDGTKIAFSKNGKIWFGNSDGTDLKELIDGDQPIGFLE